MRNKKGDTENEVSSNNAGRVQAVPNPAFSTRPKPGQPGDGKLTVHSRKWMAGLPDGKN